MDRKSKAFIIIYLFGRTINFISWIIDLADQRQGINTDFLISEFLDFLSTYIVTLGLYIFVFDMLKVKALLESESNLQHTIKNRRI